jgi:phosphoglycolate phosphatase-like HAD superfamily hydrolase
MRIEPSFLFDLDGTPVDSVYQHVLAWKAALDAEKIELSVWRIHRKIGMSGGPFYNQLLRETALESIQSVVSGLQRPYARAYQQPAEGGESGCIRRTDPRKHSWVGSANRPAASVQAHLRQSFRQLRPSRFSNSNAPGGPSLPAG